MRKADYALLAEILRSKIEYGRAQKMHAETMQIEAIARQFADRASVNKTEFLKACGIE